MNEDQNKLANQEQSDNLMKRMVVTDKAQTESIVKRIMTSEIKWIVFIVAFIVGVVAPYYQIRQDLALTAKEITLIKENHLAHIEQIEKTIAEQQKEINTMKETEVQLMITIAERLPKK